MGQLGIKKIDASPTGIVIQFIPNPPIDPIIIIQLIQTNKNIQLNGQDRLKITPTQPNGFDSLNQRIDALKLLISTLKGSNKASLKK